jgi:hypothetical protein
LITICSLIVPISVAATILGGYFGLFLLFKLKSALSGKKPVVAEVPKVVASTSDSGEVPSIDSPEFEAYLEKLLSSEEMLTALIEKIG